MTSVNKAILLGRVGKDPETRSAGGSDMVTFSVATSEKWKDQERTSWHNVVVFNDYLVEIAQKYVTKGSRVYIEGQIQTRAWEKDGQKRYTTEIVLGKFRGALIVLDKRDDAGRADEPEPSGRADLDDEIPF